MDRRDFLRNTTLALGLAASPSTLRRVMQAQAAPAGGQTPRADHARTPSGEMLYRTLGRTGERVSAIGLGGWHIGATTSEAESIRLMRTAIDHGINFLDNCWDYHSGDSEVRMGKALQHGYRDKVFLMSKIDGRTKDAAARQIDESLRRLQTDHVDLMQHHEIIRLDDPDRIFADGGAQQAMLAAQKAGKIRYIGFTGHKDPLVHNRMLDIAAEHGSHFDAVQMPLNVMDAHFRSFAKDVLPRLVKEEIGVLGMKPLAAGATVESKTVTAIECLHYALNLPTSVVITGMETMERLEQALEAVRTFKPMSSEQVQALLARTAQAAANGKHELFKTGDQFDGTARHPAWLG